MILKFKKYDYIINTTYENPNLGLTKNKFKLKYVNIDLKRNLFLSQTNSYVKKFINLGPIILLYYLSISEIDSQFENYFEILSFNLQLIVI